MSLHHPSGHFTLQQSFLCHDPFGFWSLGYTGAQGSGWRGHACVKNLPLVGGEVCAKFGGDWSGGWGVKRGHRYIVTNSRFYIERLANLAPVLHGKNLLSLHHPSRHFTLQQSFLSRDPFGF